MAKKKEVKTEIPNEEIDEIDSIIEHINSNLKGEGRIFRASEIEGTFTKRIPSLITSLDKEIGGGIQANGIIQLAGAENSGKTALSYLFARNVQKIYGAESRIALLTVEPYDKKFAKDLGFQVRYNQSEIDAIERSYKDQGLSLTDEQKAYLALEIGKVYVVRCPTTEIILQTAFELAASGKFHLIIIDSVAAMESLAAEEKSLSEATRGGNAKALSAFFRKMSSVYSQTAIILINHIIDNMDAGLYGKKYLLPGGHGLKHASLITIVLSSGERFKETVGKKEVQYGKEVNFFIEKGKAGCSDGGKGSYPYYNGKLGRPFGFDLEADLLVNGVYYGIFNTKGAWYYFGEEALGQGKEAAASKLRERPELFDMARKKIFAKEGIYFTT